MVVKVHAVVTLPLLISKVKQAFETISSVYGMGASKIYATTSFERFLESQGSDEMVPVNINISQLG